MSGKLKNIVLPCKLKELYLNADLADVNFVFKMEGKTEFLPANKSILDLFSPVFLEMFSGAMKESDEVLIVDVKAAAFKEFLQFFYLTEVSLTKENIIDVVKLAHKYDMPDCFDKLIKYLRTHLTSDTMCLGYQLAIMFEIENLKLFCESKIEMFPLEVFESESFIHIDKCVLRNILELDLLRCDECDVLRACLVWAESSCKQNFLDHRDVKNLRIQLGDCLDLIRYSSMKFETFAAILNSYRGLFTLEELEDIILSMTIKGHKSEKFNPTLQSRMGLFKWIDNTSLKCSRANYTNDTKYYILPRESTIFSTNHQVVLGRIYFERLLNSTTRLVDSIFTVKIIETIGTSVEDTVENVVHKQDYSYCNLFSNFVNLPRPLVIRPERMYEIRVESENALLFGLYHERNWLTKTYINDEIVVKFHYDSSVENGDRGGLVNSLYFNLL